MPKEESLLKLKLRLCNRKWKRPPAEKTEPAGRRKCYCAVCGHKCKEKSHLIDHMQARHLPEDRAFACPLCGLCFKTKAGVRAHKSIHATARNFVCDTCGFQTTNTQNLRGHKLIHGDETKQCKFPGCARMFKTTSNLWSHMLHAHRTESDSCVCEQCGKWFVNLPILRQHCRQVHNPDVTVQSCQQCGREFKRGFDLRRHVQTVHEGIKVKRRKQDNSKCPSQVARRLKAQQARELRSAGVRASRDLERTAPRVKRIASRVTSGENRRSAPRHRLASFQSIEDCGMPPGGMQEGSFDHVTTSEWRAATSYETSFEMIGTEDCGLPPGSMRDEAFAPAASSGVPAAAVFRVASREVFGPRHCAPPPWTGVPEGFCSEVIPRKHTSSGYVTSRGANEAASSHVTHVTSSQKTEPEDSTPEPWSGMPEGFSIVVRPGKKRPRAPAASGTKTVARGRTNRAKAPDVNVVDGHGTRTESEAVAGHVTSSDSGAICATSSSASVATGNLVVMGNQAVSRELYDDPHHTSMIITFDGASGSNDIPGAVSVQQLPSIDSTMNFLPDYHFAQPLPLLSDLWQNIMRS